MDLSGTAGKFDLAAYEQDSQGNVLRAGLVPGLASAPLLVQNITLDHPLDQARTVTVTGSDAYGPKVTYGVDVAVDSYYLFGTEVSGPPAAATLSTVAPTGAFAGVKYTARAYVSRAADPEPIAVAWAPLDGASVTLDLLAPPIVQTPPLTGTPVALAAFDVTWTADPSVQYSILNVQQNAGTGAELFWDITSPTTVGEFVPFALPADASPVALKPGQCIVWLTTSFDSLLGEYQDLYSAKPPNYFSPAATYRDAELIGVVQLQ